MNRLAAIAAGSRFFQGKPCKHGHYSDRYTVNGSCVECTRHKALVAEMKKREAINKSKSGDKK